MGTHQNNRPGLDQLFYGVAFVLATAISTLSYPAPSLSQTDTSGLLRSLTEAASQGAPWFNVRYRFEHVDQAGLARDARANTVRTRLGYATGSWRGLSLLLEVENTSHVGDDRFNDGSDPLSAEPRVVDPDSTEINQAILRAELPWRTELIAGRHRVVLDNERFFGDANFRQNQQTFDGITLINLALPKTELRYDLLTGVQRPLGSDARSGSFNTRIDALHFTYRGIPQVIASAYGYFVDVDDDPSLSSRTVGARIVGERRIEGALFATVAAEFARQNDMADNPGSFALNYYRLQPGLRLGDATVSIGLEVLEGNGTSAVQTPFATQHKFLGFADVFTTTPAEGIEDRFLMFGHKWVRVAPFDSVRVWGAYHDFVGEHASMAYGSEVDVAIAFNFLRHYRLTAKYATYDADRIARNIDRFWLMLELSF